MADRAKDEVDRISRIVVRQARRYGVSAAVYANQRSFDVMTERWRELPSFKREYDGLRWVRRKTRDLYLSPAATARSLRNEISKTWG